MGVIANEWLSVQLKIEILLVIESSLQQGCSVRRSCLILNIAHRRVVRWKLRARLELGLANLKPGPRFAHHRMLPEEIQRIVSMAQSQKYVDLSHRMMAVTALDQDIFQASFTTVYRVRRASRKPCDSGSLKNLCVFEGAKAKGRRQLGGRRPRIDRVSVPIPRSRFDPSSGSSCHR